GVWLMGMYEVWKIDHSKVVLHKWMKDSTVIGVRRMDG
ncbi:hypothetical protein ACMD2_11298, partial [Ananas comosus]